jgi:hypothetical protein
MQVLSSAVIMVLHLIPMHLIYAILLLFDASQDQQHLWLQEQVLPDEVAGRNCWGQQGQTQR